MALKEQKSLDGVRRDMKSHVAAPLWRLVLQRASAIAAFNEVGASPVFYCVHPIAGDVTSFYSLAQSLGPEQPFYGIQVPKEKMNAAFPVSIKAVAQYYVETLVAFQPEGAFVLGGWSVGAIIALEMAQQLRTIGREVPLLVALDGAPCNTGAGISRWNPIYIWKLACNLPVNIKYKARHNKSWYLLVKSLAHGLRVKTQVASVIFRNDQTIHGEAIKNAFSTTGWLSSQILFVRALYDAMRAYVPEPYVGRVLVYEAKAQPLNHLLQIGAVWTKIANSVEVVHLDGNHVSMFQEPTLGVLTAHLRMRLAEIRQSICA